MTENKIETIVEERLREHKQKVILEVIKERCSQMTVGDFCEAIKSLPTDESYYFIFETKLSDIISPLYVKKEEKQKELNAKPATKKPNKKNENIREFILNVIRENPGITRREITEKLEAHKPSWRGSVGWHLDFFRHQKMVRVESNTDKGRKHFKYHSLV